MGFENTDKKTAQEVPLLFQGPAFILLHIQVCLGRQQPRASPRGWSPGSRRRSTPGTRSQSVPKEGKGQTSEGKGGSILIPCISPTQRAHPWEQGLSPAPPPRTYP